MKKVLYFPGLFWILNRNSDDVENSPKIKLLKNIANLDIYDYTKLIYPEGLNIEYDSFIGSSFGGYFAIHFGSKLNKMSFSINPSVELNERLNLLKNIYPNELSFINDEFIKNIHSNDLLLKENCKHTNVFVNLNDELLDPVIRINYSKKYNFNLYTFEKGEHKANNFKSEILPIIENLLY